MSGPVLGPLPTPTAGQVFVDLDAVTNGTGTSDSPFNMVPGQTTGDTIVNAGTRITVRGRWRFDGGQFRRPGTTTEPVVYDFADEAWGTTTVDNAVDIETAPCANIGEAFGNTAWASMVRGSVPDGRTTADIRRVIYGGGAARELRYCSIYPQLSDAQWGYYQQYLTYDSLADAFWPAATFDAAVSRGRYDLRGTAPEKVALRAALVAGTQPYIQQRTFPNIWRTVPAYRGDADGTPNAAGDYLIGAETGWGAATNYTDLADHLFAVLNVPAFITPGRWAMNPVDGWVVYHPTGGGDTISRSRGTIGLGIWADNLWLNGGNFVGFSNNSAALYVNGSRSNIVIRNQTFGARGGLDDRSGSHVTVSSGFSNIIVRNLTFGATTMARGIVASTGDGLIISRISSRGVRGSNCALIGTHLRNALIEKNYFADTIDIHGNGITAYINCYNVVIDGNVVVNSSRPLTTERNAAAYNYGLYGPPSLTIRNGVFVSEGVFDPVAYAVRSQDTLPIVGLRIENSALGSYAGRSLSIAPTHVGSVVTGAEMIGLTYADTGALAGGVGNTLIDHATAGGQERLDELSAALVT